MFRQRQNSWVRDQCRNLWSNVDISCEIQTLNREVWELNTRFTLRQRSFPKWTTQFCKSASRDTMSPGRLCASADLPRRESYPYLLASKFGSTRAGMNEAAKSLICLTLSEPHKPYSVESDDDCKWWIKKKLIVAYFKVPETSPTKQSPSWFYGINKLRL